MRQSIRTFGFVACVAAAAAVFFMLAPKVPTQTLAAAAQYQSLIAQALSDDSANNLLTQGAPQQTVVNGWTARDLLTIIAKESQDILIAQTTPFDDRLPALLLIGVIALCWSGLSASSSARPSSMPRPLTPAPSVG